MTEKVKLYPKSEDNCNLLLLVYIVNLQWFRKVTEYKAIVKSVHKTGWLHLSVKLRHCKIFVFKEALSWYDPEEKQHKKQN